MSSNQPSGVVSFSPRVWHRAALATTLAWSWLLGCSVYDSSLLISSGESPLTNDAGGAGIDALVSGSGGSASLGGDDSGGSPSTGGAVTSQGGSDPIGLDSAGAAGAGAFSVPEAGSASGGSFSGSSGGVAGAGAGAGGAGAGTSAGGRAGTSGAGGVGVHELALGKPALASSTQTSNVAASGNDGNLATRWCAVNGSYPQWWRVDLGAAYSLSKFSVQFEHPERTYGYTIETSPDDKLYTLQATLSGKGAVQSSDFRAGVSGRYLRITVTSGDVWMDANGTHNPWASFFEFSVTGS